MYHNNQKQIYKIINQFKKFKWNKIKNKNYQINFKSYHYNKI